MISKMRDYAPIIMWIVIITFVGTIFFAWGMDFSGMGNKNLAGKIDGKQITLEYFDRLVNMERQRLQQRMSSDVPDYQYNLIPKQVWEQEVAKRVAAKTYDRIHLEATADDIFEHLKNNPPPGIDTSSYFQTNGKFDTTKYIAFLNNPSSYDNPGLRELEEYTQKSIVPMLKLETLIKAGAVPSRAEIAREYKINTERARFEYAFIGQHEFTVDSSELKPEQIARYYQAHQDSFTSDDQAELYYLSLAKKPTANDDKVYRDEMNEIRGKLMSREITFDEEAKLESDDQGSAEKGGELGWFTKGTMVPEFEAVAFSLDTGVISEPVKTPFGYHLIKVEAKEKKGDTLRIKARHILRKIYPTVETLDSLKEHIDSLRDRCVSEGPKAVASGDNAIKFDSTGLFKKGDLISGIGFISGVSRFAFDNEPGTVCDAAFETKEAYYVFQVKRKVKKGLVPLEDVREKIAKVLIDSLQLEKAKARLAADLGAPVNRDSLASISKNDALVKSGLSDTVTQRSFVPPIGSGNDAIIAAFTIPLNTTSDLIKVPGGYCAVRPVWRLAVDVIPWDSYQIQAVRRSMEQQNSQEIPMAWFAAEKNNMKVVSFLDRFYMQ